MVDYQEIMGRLIKNSFPILRQKRIFILKFRSKKYTGGFYWILPFLRVIFINSNLKEKKKVKSIFIHELCHLEINQKRGWISSVLRNFMYWSSPRIRREEEKDTEELAIRKGYAKEIYKLSKVLYNKKKKYKIDKYYLSPEEIKSYAKKIGKW